MAKTNEAAAARRVALLRRIAALCGAFVRYVELKRALAAADRTPHLNFWRVTYGGLTNLAVLDWCKLFGASGSNATHWKRVFPDREAAFRTELLKRTALSAADFEAYWREIKKWRDTDFAHLDPEAKPASKWPDFETALKATELYYDWVVSELDDAGVNMFPASLATYRAALRSELDRAAALAVAATRDLPASKL